MAEIVASGGRALCVAVDVTDHASVSQAVATACDFASGLAAIVNNAAIVTPLARLHLGDPDAWAEAMRVNVLGPYNAIRAALPVLRRGGVIVNLSSGAAHRPVEGWSAYCASKAALAMLTRSVFAEYGDVVRVYGVQPGLLDTDMQAEIRASGLGPPSRLPRSALADVAGAARAIAWLVRTAPADLSGTEIDVDGVALRRRMDGG